MHQAPNPYFINNHLMFQETVTDIPSLYTPKYSSCKSTLSRYKRSNFPSDPKNYFEIPEQCDYYFGENNICLLLYKSEKTMIFCSERQLEIFANANEIF